MIQPPSLGGMAGAIVERLVVYYRLPLVKPYLSGIESPACATIIPNKSGLASH